MASRNIFRFEKWHFNVTLPAGEVVFFFPAKTRILNWTDGRLSLTVTSPGAKPIHRSLNGLGYELMSSGYQDTAIAVFLLNLEFHPQSANCNDSLAEGYDRKGDRTNALKYYRQAIELLNRFPERNKDYERSRAAALEKIRKLESELKK